MDDITVCNRSRSRINNMSRILASFILTLSLGVFSFAQAEEVTTVASSNDVANNSYTAPTLQDGQDAFNAGNYDLAFAHWQTLATEGHTDAQVFVGLSYANGWGVDKSTRLASHWYKKAAISENASAQFLLGLYLITGKDADLPMGVMWLKRAAENGDESARRFMKKAKTRGWFKDVPTIEYENKPEKIETVALADNT